MDTITTIQKFLTCNGSAQPVMVALMPNETRLIAAAPDMAEALEKLLVKFANCARAHGNGAGVIDAATEQARAALARARGET